MSVFLQCKSHCPVFTFPSEMWPLVYSLSSIVFGHYFELNMGLCSLLIYSWLALFSWPCSNSYLILWSCMCHVCLGPGPPATSSGGPFSDPLTPQDATIAWVGFLCSLPHRCALSSAQSLSCLSGVIIWVSWLSEGRRPTLPLARLLDMWFCDLDYVILAKRQGIRKGIKVRPELESSSCVVEICRELRDSSEP